MRLLIVFLFIFQLWGCRHPEPLDNVELLNGYWEIEWVEFPDGSRKEFGISTTVDFIEITADSGLRKKVSPRLDGTFETSESAEKFTFAIDDGILEMHYRTPYHKWTEIVQSLKEEQLVVKNEDNKVYGYKRYQPLNINK